MDRRRFLTTATAMSAAAVFDPTQARAQDHLKWAVFTPDHEVTFRTVMKRTRRRCSAIAATR